jgi:hypothetical protein
MDGDIAWADAAPLSPSLAAAGVPLVVPQSVGTAVWIAGGTVGGVTGTHLGSVLPILL